MDGTVGGVYSKRARAPNIDAKASTSWEQLPKALVILAGEKESICTDCSVSAVVDMPKWAQYPNETFENLVLVASTISVFGVSLRMRTFRVHPRARRIRSQR